MRAQPTTSFLAALVLGLVVAACGDEHESASPQQGGTTSNNGGAASDSGGTKATTGGAANSGGSADGGATTTTSGGALLSAGAAGASASPSAAECHTFCDGENGIVARCSAYLPEAWHDQAACELACTRFIPDSLACWQLHLDNVIRTNDSAQHCPHATGAPNNRHCPSP